jgi:cytochrome c biogenesis protein CcdA
MQWIKVSLLLTIIASLFIQPAALAAQTSEPQPVRIEIFSRPDCIHCQDQKAFLEELSQTRSDFIVTDYNIYQPANQQLWLQLTELENLSKVTPITLIGQTLVIGFGTPDTTGRQIETLINFYAGKPESQTTFSDYIIAGKKPVQLETITTDGTCDDDCAYPYEPFYVTIPLINQTIDVKQYSLPTLSIILGFIDGFNPCAMWVLVSFLIILVQVGDRRKMWTFAGLFIIAEALMYGLILTVWFSAWDFVSLDKYVTPIVGLMAIGGGIFFLYEWKTADGACKVTSLKQRAKTQSKIKSLTAKPLTIATALGIIGLALSVNIVEFACSIGIPQAFTKILELNGLSLLQSWWYIILYILFYMVDDLIVFGIALYSFEKIGLTTKYSRWSNLIGGLLMLLLGLLLIFKPQWLMFS